jgi:uncharacterized protein
VTCKPLPAADRVPQPWRNGGGVTCEIAREPHPHPRREDDFLWRVSLAEVASPGPFSLFAGHRRLIAVISGQGMTLRRTVAQTVEERIVLEPWRVFCFEGSDRVEGELPLGAVRDFNVIFDATRMRATLSFHQGPRPLTLNSAVAIVCNAGPLPVSWECASQKGELRHLDALHLRADSARFDLAAGGRVALVTLEDLPG